MRMRTIGIGFLLSSLTLPLGGCASHLISSARPDGHCAAGQPCSVSQTSVAGRQGISTNGAAGYVTRDECGDEALRRVEVRRDLGQGLISLLTLGIVNPATIYFTCDKAEISSGDGEQNDDEF